MSSGNVKKVLELTSLQAAEKLAEMREGMVPSQNQCGDPGGVYRGVWIGEASNNFPKKLFLKRRTTRFPEGDPTAIASRWCAVEGFRHCRLAVKMTRCRHKACAVLPHMSPTGVSQCQRQRSKIPCQFRRGCVPPGDSMRDALEFDLTRGDSSGLDFPLPMCSPSFQPTPLEGECRRAPKTLQLSLL